MAKDELNIDALIDVPTYAPGQHPDNNTTYRKPAAWKQFKQCLGTYRGGKLNETGKMALEMERLGPTMHHLDPRLILEAAMKHFLHDLTYAEQYAILFPTFAASEAEARQKELAARRRGKS
jgi:hypothetical protein